ncbi:MAG: hypothetical protein EA389_08945 [Ilumatobacter sp.]|nr:MAG: hypothetical protein EA389_08945 [Ilumatobacter sp.]
MTTVTVTTELEAPADTIWTVVQTTEAFEHVTRGLVSLPAIRELDEFREGATVSGPLRLFGVLPISRHRITIDEIDTTRRRLRTREGGGLLRSWVHDIEVDDDPSGRPDHCCYTDRIEIDARWATPAVAVFARVFYRLRQRRWRALARVLGATTRVGPLAADH